MSLSRADLRILQILQTDGRISNVALAERVAMSPSPCLRRVRTLEEEGFIAGYGARLDRRRLGFGILAHVEVRVPQVAGQDIVTRFKEAVVEQPQIIRCFVTAGQYDFLLEVVARDMDDYGRVAQNVLLKLPGVQDMKSSFVLEEVKGGAELPLES